MIKSKDDLPQTIFLQWADDDGELLDPEEQTWCHVKIFNHDAEYELKREGDKDGSQ